MQAMSVRVAHGGEDEAWDGIRERTGGEEGRVAMEGREGKGWRDGEGENKGWVKSRMQSMSCVLRSWAQGGKQGGASRAMLT